MKKFEIIIFYEGVVYHAYSYADRSTYDDLYKLIVNLCYINNLPVSEVELLDFSFEFISDDDINIMSGVDV